MSPLLAAPNRGYADGQRISNYDSGVLWQRAVSTQNTNIVSPVLDMSRYGYTAGTLSCSLANCSVTIFWYADAAATITLGSRKFIMNLNIVDVAYVRLPNLGPFAQFTIAPVAGASYTFASVIIGTNRVHPLEFIPANPVLIDVQNAAIGASATVSTYPTDYYAGPVSFQYNNASGTGTFQLFKNNSAAGGDLMYQDVNFAAGTWRSVTLLAPAGAWFVNVTNNGAAGNFYLNAMQSATGAA